MTQPLVQSAGITFPVSDVSPAETPLKESDYFEALEGILNSPVLACAWQHKKLVAMQQNAFVFTVHSAFNDHHPLILSPDHLWLVLAQGMARHIRANAETLRSRFVTHQDQEKITVVHPGLLPDNPLSPWDEGVTLLAQEVRRRILQPDFITARFSTTGDIETAVYEMTLLEAMGAYFMYGVTLCGIPLITLEGTPDDWHHIAARMQDFRQYGLDTWVDVLEPVLAEFVAASQGQVNTAFWQSIYKYHEESGGPYITGWITKLFPYVEVREWKTKKKNLVQSPWLTNEPVRDNEGMRLYTDFSSGLSIVPFTFDDGLKEQPLEFAGGFVGASQHAETNALRPEIGWAVRRPPK